MRKIIGLTFFGLLMAGCTPANADVFVVHFPDGRIHTVEEKPFEVLQPGMQRAVAPDWPALHPSNYLWKNNQFEIKSDAMLDQERQARLAIQERFKRLDKIDAQLKLKAIQDLQTADPNEDYSKEAAEFQKIIDDLKK